MDIDVIFLQTWKCQSRLPPIVLLRYITFWTELSWMLFGWYWNMCSLGPSNLRWAQVLHKEWSKNTMNEVKEDSLSLSAQSNSCQQSRCLLSLDTCGSTWWWGAFMVTSILVHYGSQQSRNGLLHLHILVFLFQCNVLLISRAFIKPKSPTLSPWCMKIMWLMMGWNRGEEWSQCPQTDVKKERSDGGACARAWDKLSANWLNQCWLDKYICCQFSASNVHEIDVRSLMKMTDQTIPFL